MTGPESVVLPLHHNPIKGCSVGFEPTYTGTTILRLNHSAKNTIKDGRVGLEPTTRGLTAKKINYCGKFPYTGNILSTPL